MSALLIITLLILLAVFIPISLLPALLSDSDVDSVVMLKE